MKIYKVKVNGKLYEVELESVTETDQKIVSAPKAKEESATVKPTPQTNTSGGTELKAPMQGVILDVRANVGDKVKKGQALFILEAMKLENEIVAPVDGTITNVLVNKDQSVETQDLLAVIE